MPHNFDMLNLEPSLGFITKSLPLFKRIKTYTGGFLHLGCYILHRSILTRLSSRILPWYGIDIDTALYKNCKMVGIFPPIFKQKDYSSNNSGTYRDLIPEGLKGIKLGQILIESSSIIGWFIMEMFQLGSVYLIYDRPPPEFKDRRICLT